MENLITDEARARRLARGFVSDIAAYHAVRLRAPPTLDDAIRELRSEVNEARMAYRSRVSDPLTDLFEQELRPVLSQFRQDGAVTPVATPAVEPVETPAARAARLAREAVGRLVGNHQPRHPDLRSLSEILEALHGPIAAVRRGYEQQVPPEFAPVFDEVLVQGLADAWLG
jgi:hypothetical protein